jgi:hypothetical protein
MRPLQSQLWPLTGSNSEQCSTQMFPFARRVRARERYIVYRRCAQSKRRMDSSAVVGFMRLESAARAARRRNLINATITHSLVAAPSLLLALSSTAVYLPSVRSKVFAVCLLRRVIIIIIYTRPLIGREKESAARAFAEKLINGGANFYFSFCCRALTAKHEVPLFCRCG